MAVIQTLEGLLDPCRWFHYDAAGDVLFCASRRDTPAVGEETEDGLIALHDEATDELVGFTVVNFWKRFGRGALPDSFREIQLHIQPLASRLAA